MAENAQNVTARALLEALGEINRLLRDHAVAVRRSPLAASAVAYLEAVSYKNGPVLEGYVEAELANGDAVCWCLDVHWTQDQWTIEATLDRKSGDRQETVKELNPETVTDFDDFLKRLKRVACELLALDVTVFGSLAGKRGEKGSA